MIKLILFDLGKTLIDGGAPFPGVVESLTVLSDFTTQENRKLLLAVVSDFGDPSNSESEVAALEAEFEGILRTAGIDRFFAPFEQRVTISARAGAFKPDRRVFQTALERSGVGATLEDCLFITENRSHLEAARALGLTILGFGEGLGDLPSFPKWREAPLLIAEIVDPTNTRNRERAISAALKQSRGMGPFTCLSQHGRTFQGQAAQLVRLDRPELGELSGVFVEIPVDVSVQCDAQGAIDEVVIQDASAEDLESAASYVQQLVRRGRIGDRQMPVAPGATHVVETDEQGRKIVVRQRFSH